MKVRFWKKETHVSLIKDQKYRHSDNKYFEWHFSIWNKINYTQRREFLVEIDKVVLETLLVPFPDRSSFLSRPNCFGFGRFETKRRRKRFNNENKWFFLSHIVTLYRIRLWNSFKVETCSKTSRYLLN